MSSVTRIEEWPTGWDRSSMRMPGGLSARWRIRDPASGTSTTTVTVGCLGQPTNSAAGSDPYLSRQYGQPTPLLRKHRGLGPRTEASGDTPAVGPCGRYDDIWLILEEVYWPASLEESVGAHEPRCELPLIGSGECLDDVGHHGERAAPAVELEAQVPGRALVSDGKDTFLAAPSVSQLRAVVGGRTTDVGQFCGAECAEVM